MVVHLSINGTGFLFPGDLEAAGWKNMLETSAGFREVVQATHVLVASHHGRENGVYAELFDTYQCKPQMVVISDDYHQYDTQKTADYYKGKSWGVSNVRGPDPRWVMTTRRDGDILFTFDQTGCKVW
jgi:beta-lactamase superfamily II metal-dependent hydrolase